VDQAQGIFMLTFFSSTWYQNISEGIALAFITLCLKLGPRTGVIAKWSSSFQSNQPALNLYSQLGCQPSLDGQNLSI